MKDKYLPSSPSSPNGQKRATAKLINTAKLKEMLPQRDMCLENQNRAGLSSKEEVQWDREKKNEFWFQHNSPTEIVFH